MPKLGKRNTNLQINNAQAQSKFIQNKKQSTQNIVGMEAAITPITTTSARVASGSNATSGVAKPRASVSPEKKVSENVRLRNN